MFKTCPSLGVLAMTICVYLVRYINAKITHRRYVQVMMLVKFRRYKLVILNTPLVVLTLNVIKYDKITVETGRLREETQLNCNTI